MFSDLQENVSEISQNKTIFKKFPLIIVPGASPTSFCDNPPPWEFKVKQTNYPSHGKHRAGARSAVCFPAKEEFLSSVVRPGCKCRKFINK